jgi:phosphatidylserine/phosphatidylglycerophosphate/cardiolipin synthase-like enzyme
MFPVNPLNRFSEPSKNQHYKLRIRDEEIVFTGSVFVSNDFGIGDHG